MAVKSLDLLGLSLDLSPVSPVNHRGLPFKAGFGIFGCAFKF